MSKMTFSAWERSVESIDTHRFLRDWVRDTYRLPNGTIVYHETYSPKHYAKSMREQAVVDVMIHEKNAIALRKVGAVLDMERYTPEGYGMPVFTGENCLKKAFNFIMNGNHTWR